MVDRVELTQIMSDALGRVVTPHEITSAEWVEQAHVPGGPFKDGMQGMYADYARYRFPGGNALVLRAILGSEPRTLKAFFKELTQTEK